MNDRFNESIVQLFNTSDYKRASRGILDERGAKVDHPLSILVSKINFGMGVIF